MASTVFKKLFRGLSRTRENLSATLSGFSGAEQVERVVTMAKQLSIEPATPDEAREIIGLKGQDKVNF